MDFDTEFPMPTFREREAITSYYEIEHLYMATPNFYIPASHLQYRRHAVSTIARIRTFGYLENRRETDSFVQQPLWHGEVLDAYIPYLAMTYFDRFASASSILDMPGASVTQKVRLVSICCLSLSAKMRTKQFILHRFMKEKRLNFTVERIMSVEYRILTALDWRLRTITPFYFLDHYYPTFKRIGGFKRRCINEIIVQSQGEHFFTQYKPSEIALCAFLAATYLAYPSKFDSINKSGELAGCYRELVNLCLTRKIELRGESGKVLPSTKMEATSTAQPSSTKTAATPTTQPNEAASAAAETQTTKSEEELAEAIVSQVNQQSSNSSSRTTQLWKTVLDIEEEEEEGTSQLTRRPRTGASKQQGQDQGKADTSGEISTEGKEDMGKGVPEASRSEVIIAGIVTKVQGQDKDKDKEVVAMEESWEEENAEAKRLRKMKGKAVMMEEEDDETGKVRFISEIVPAAQAAPRNLMNFELQWPITVQPGEVLDYLDESLQIDESRRVSIRCPQTIRGTGNDPPLNASCCNCTIS
ncbi:putative cyclin-D6-1, partial [Mucuna pruriens]